MTAAYDKIKSTIDRYCGDAAAAISVDLITAGYLTVAFATMDLDDVVAVDEKLKTEAPLLGWSVEHVLESPRAPLFAVTFRVGVRIPNDASNSAQAKAISALQAYFQPGKTIDIGDFIDPAATGLTYGRLYMASATTASAAVDANSSVRDLRIEARASCK